MKLLQDMTNSKPSFGMAAQVHPSVGKLDSRTKKYLNTLGEKADIFVIKNKFSNEISVTAKPLEKPKTRTGRFLAKVTESFADAKLVGYGEPVKINMLSDTMSHSTYNTPVTRPLFRKEKGESIVDAAIIATNKLTDKISKLKDKLK